MTSSQPNPAPEREPAGTLDRALDLVRFLRQNCPWDAAQTPTSLVPYLLEEAHETADAIQTADDAHMAGELGDLLLNVAFQIVLAEERTSFTAENVVSGLEEKMRRRHPHLYGDGPQVPWEELKAQERASSIGGESVLAGLGEGLEPLSRAHRIQERVSAVGFDWSDYTGALEKVGEELGEVREALSGGPSPAVEEEIGDLLFAVVNLARLTGVHSLTALGAANRKFTSRFTALERLAVQRGVVLGEASLAELDVLWDEVKRRGG